MRYPALDVRGIDADLVMAVAADFSPGGAEEHDTHITLFFTDRERRTRAREAIVRALPEASVAEHDVDDGDWARRSQVNLPPVVVGRLIVVASPDLISSNRRGLRPPRTFRTLQTSRTPIPIVIAPSMGFGTGHHATTRLCLAALQAIDLSNASVVDVGTGSGILALAAGRLGATTVLGVDSDEDAIRSAVENRSLNNGLEDVRFELGDLDHASLPTAHVVVANLTGALLRRSAAVLIEHVRPAGRVIVSGLQISERSSVVDAFLARRARLLTDATEDGWVCLSFEQ